MSEFDHTLSPELVSIAEFLAQTLPFNELEPEDLLRVANALVVQYHCRGEIFSASTEPEGLRILRSGAVDLRDSDNKLLDRLGEGESFHIGGLNAERGEVQATVIEDALCYLLPDKHYQAARAADRRFDRYFSSQRNRRLRRAARYEPEANTMMREVRSVMSTCLLTVPISATVREVATAMAERSVSSAFVMEGDDLVGIVTDRDLRTRHVARGLAPDTSVLAVMTADPLTIQGSDNLFQTTLTMTREGIHHLPVMANGGLVGVVTTSDLILARQDDPVYLVQHISRQTDVESIRGLLEGMPNLLVQWVNSGVRAPEVSRILTAISDAVTVRLIQLAQERLGPAPVAWCWVGFGSQARAEQLLGADQDNGIIVADDYRPEHAAWFQALAERVCEDLDVCGYVYCPGDIMAKTAEWRQPLAAWRETVQKWARTPTAEAVMRVSIFFDLRSIYGDHTLCDELQSTMLQVAGSNTIFLAALAANALDSKPPLGIFRRFVVDRNGDHVDELDLKKRGVLPVTEIVRLHALANGITAVNTSERIQALAETGLMTLTESRNLADALNFIQQQRVYHQCKQTIAGEAISNHLRPGSLPKMAKEQLRDAFTIIDEAQSAVRQRYRAGLG